MTSANVQFLSLQSCLVLKQNMTSANVQFFLAVMADVKTENDQCECPVCQEDYKDPKLLRCGHTICRQCVLSWLETGGPQKGCPLCRASILPPQSAGSNTAVDVAGLVDVLPADVASLAVVDCKHLLQGDHFCNVCDDDNPASSICIDCNLKVCAACSKTHRKFPAFREHSVEQINTLTPERLAALRKSFCDVHKDRQAELYCPTDRSLICFLCSSSKHRTCPGVDVLADCATKEREGLKGLSERLRKKRTYLEAQVTSPEVYLSGTSYMKQMHVNKLLKNTKRKSEKNFSLTFSHQCIQTESTR